MIYARLLPLSFISLVVSFQAQELRYFYLLSQWYYVSHPRGPSLQQGQCIMKRQTWTLSEQLGAGSPPALGCKEPLALWSWKWRSLNRQNLCQCGSLLLLRLTNVTFHFQLHTYMSDQGYKYIGTLGGNLKIWRNCLIFSSQTPMISLSRRICWTVHIIGTGTIYLKIGKTHFLSGVGMISMRRIWKTQNQMTHDKYIDCQHVPFWPLLWTTFKMTDTLDG